MGIFDSIVIGIEWEYMAKCWYLGGAGRWTSHGIWMDFALALLGKLSPTGWCPPVMWMLVYEPH